MPRVEYGTGTEANLDEVNRGETYGYFIEAA